jgi:hypothetical protein
VANIVAILAAAEKFPEQTKVVTVDVAIVGLYFTLRELKLM